MEKAKKLYVAPAIEPILIDNEISLVLQSTPPVEPDEIAKNNADCFNNNLFHSENV